ncbi:hypothetical protein FCOIX_9641 [Fusarium coicis]|nr:hypothetical protein FCOIX_9641 [Fusarium coicis]
MGAKPVWALGTRGHRTDHAFYCEATLETYSYPHQHSLPSLKFTSPKVTLTDIDTRPACFIQGVERKENTSAIDRAGSVGLQRLCLLSCTAHLSAHKNTIQDSTLREVG